MLYFHEFAYFSGTKPGHFDPSGHLTCGLLACANWISILTFVASSSPQYFTTKVARIVSLLIYVALVYHLYGIFFTVVVYHDAFESLAGYLYAILIYGLVFWIDFFSESVFFILINLCWRSQAALINE